MRTVGGPEKNRVVLVDGNNLIYKAFFAFQAPAERLGLRMRVATDGTQTNVVFGFISFLNRLLAKLEYSEIIVCFDGVSAERLKIDPAYKSHRANAEFSVKTYNGLTGLVELLLKLGVRVAFDKDYESDDLIATYVANFPDHIKYIISDDKDFFQLLSNRRTVVLRPSDPELRPIDYDASIKIWSSLNKGTHPGVVPESVRMFKALCGDSSDGIKGIPRFKKKVAAELATSRTIDQLPSTLSFCKDSKIKQTVIDNYDLIKRNYGLTGFFHHPNLSKCIQSSERNFSEARKFAEERLGIDDLEIGAFLRHMTVSVPVMDI